MFLEQCERAFLMKLKSAQIRMFKNIIDSTPVKIDEKVTCVVGKNESGKTAFLQALFCLNPARINPEFSILDHYPAWLEKRHRKDGKDLDAVTPISVELEWQTDDVAAVTESFGDGVVKEGDILTLSMTYKNEFRWVSGCSEARAALNFLNKTPVPESERASYTALKSFGEIGKKLAQDVTKYGENAESLKILLEAQEAQKKFLDNKDTFSAAAWKIAFKRIPKFFYFADFSKLPYTVDIEHVLKSDNLSESEATARVR
ncbi:AAA family ATPase [bacterium]|nr:AAA family ATPase [bacterium]